MLTDHVVAAEYSTATGGPIEVDILTRSPPHDTRNIQCQADKWSNYDSRRWTSESPSLCVFCFTIWRKKSARCSVRTGAAWMPNSLRLVWKGPSAAPSTVSEAGKSIPHSDESTERVASAVGTTPCRRRESSLFRRAAGGWRRGTRSPWARHMNRPWPGEFATWGSPAEVGKWTEQRQDRTTFFRLEKIRLC